MTFDARHRELDADVAIVGYGPVGATLAILLAQTGRRVVVVERRPGPYALPRAVHVDHEAARIIQSCGVGDDFRAVSEPAPVYEWRNGAGQTLLRIGRVGDGGSGWPESSMFHQPHLEALLDRRAASLPGIEVRRGAEVVGLHPDAGSVAVELADGSEVGARYVVGCDGANSTVRTLAGLPVEDLGFVFDWLIVDVILDTPRVFDPVNLQVCDPSRPTTAVSGGPGRRRWEWMRLPDETVEELDTEQRAWQLLAPWDVHPGNARIERHALYTFGAQYVSKWRDGSVFVAGDAAHLMPPFAGQGLCSGLRDAANLAWKLELVLSGAADASVLDTYGQERLPSTQQAIDFSVDLGGIICVADPAEAEARDAAMVGSVGDEPVEAPPPPGIDAGVVRPGSPHAGTLFIQGSDRGRQFDDVHGPGWRLFVAGSGAALVDPAVRSWFESIGGLVVAVRSEDPAYGRWLADHGLAAALERPDFRLFGTASGAGEVTSLVADLRSSLGA